MMFKYSIQNVRILDEISALVTNNIPENKHLEYKSTLPSSSDKENLLLKPLCAFANSSGGIIIYGITEKSSFLTLSGVDLCMDIDSTKLQIENFIQFGTDPPIRGTEIAIHKLPNMDRYAVLLQVRKSFYGPHREVKTSRFYGRHSSGTYQMDIAEIRGAFTLSANIIDRIKNYIDERLTNLELRNTIIPLVPGPSIVLHVMPLSAFMDDHTYGIAHLKKLEHKWRPEIFRYSGWQQKIVLEGLIGTSPKNKVKCDRYDLLFRTGVIESVSVLPPIPDHPPAIPSKYIEKMLLSDANRFMNVLKELDFHPPFILFLSYLGVKNYYLSTKQIGLTHTFDRNKILLSSSIIESFDENINKIMRFLFDQVWNCCGLLESENFCMDHNFIE